MTADPVLVGVFDSGVGGLTVVRELLARRPDLRIMYVADQAHVPYGGRCLDEVRGFALAISRYLAMRGCQTIVMACNISSATALGTASAHLAPIPVYGMIEPAAAKIASALDPRVAILATVGTVQSGAYSRAIHAYRSDADVCEIACPDFVPLVESGDTDGDHAMAAAHEYLSTAASFGAHTIVLGCTHYPYLIGALHRAARRLFAADVDFVDPAVETAEGVARCLSPGVLTTGTRRHEFLTTGPLDRYSEQIRALLPGLCADLRSVRWDPDLTLR